MSNQLWARLFQTADGNFFLRNGDYVQSARPIGDPKALKVRRITGASKSDILKKEALRRAPTEANSYVMGKILSLEETIPGVLHQPVWVAPIQYYQANLERPKS